MKTTLVLLGIGWLAFVLLVFTPADNHTPAQTQLQSQTGMSDEEIKIIFCRSVWNAGEESGKMLVKVLSLRLNGVPEIAIRVNLEKYGLLNAQLKEIISIAYHNTKRSTARKIVKMCGGWANG